MIRPVRESAEGVLAVRDEHPRGGHGRPWSVVFVPPGHISNYPTQSLSDVDVAGWCPLAVREGQP